MTDAEVRELLAQLPRGHISSPALRTIEYVDELKEEETSPRHRRFSRLQILGEWSINKETNEGSAIIFRQHTMGNPNRFNFLNSILHEIGHAVYYRLSPGDKGEWAKLNTGTVILMNAQSRAADEHFCHLYAAYFCGMSLSAPDSVTSIPS